MKEFFDQIKSITDILNVGRLIFYPFAGALVVVPSYLLARILLKPPAMLLSLQLKNDILSINQGLGLAVFVLASIVVGFLVAVAGFTVVDRAGAEISKEIAAQSQSSDRSVSFTYNYPLLRQKKDEDYSTWLISEYFRYVEIATYIPLGGIVGLGLMTLYVLIFVIWQFAEEAATEAASAHLVLTVLVSVWIIVKWYVWPQVWVKQVIAPTLRSYLRAKASLIAGVKVVERQVGPFKEQASGTPAQPA